jgi:hypothetical protein
MIKLTTPEAIESQINKARTVKPLVRVLQFRKYAVTNKQTGATYTVEFTRQGREKFAGCTCKAGERGRACYHVAAAASIHMQIAQERAALQF